MSTKCSARWPDQRSVIPASLPRAGTRPTLLDPHPEERRLRRVSKDEGRRWPHGSAGDAKASSRDGARAPPHHEGVSSQPRNDGGNNKGAVARAAALTFALSLRTPAAC